MKNNLYFDSIDSALSTIYGHSMQIKSKIPINGGDINSAYMLVLSDGSCLFMKTNRPENLSFFQAEAMGVSYLSETDCIGTPHILAYGLDKNRGCSFLLMDFIASARRKEDYWEVFGRELANMHLHGNASAHGFIEDNYIGYNLQKNDSRESWIDFFRDCRLLPQIQMANPYLSLETRDKLDYILKHLDRYLREPDHISLLHGDLWSGNAISGPDGKAWIIDPAVYYGDHETDLAMTQLFGAFPKAFYDAYNEVYPIDSNFEDRRGIYDLYHMLNHLNMFGRGYLGEVLSIVNVYTK